MRRGAVRGKSARASGAYGAGADDREEPVSVWNNEDLRQRPWCNKDVALGYLRSDRMNLNLN